MNAKVIVEMTFKEYEEYRKSLETQKQPSKQMLKQFTNKEIFDELCRRGHGEMAFAFDASSTYDLHIDLGDGWVADFKAEEKKEEAE